MTIQKFLAQQKAVCEQKAIQIARLELSIWDSNHEQQLKSYFKFSGKAIQKRKAELFALTNSKS